MNVLVAICGVALCLLQASARTKPKPKTPTRALSETTVYRNGDDGYTCYRIPAIVRAPNGDLLAFAEGRKKNCGDFGDVDIVLKTSRDNGRTWSALQVVVDSDTNQAGNPAPVFDLLDSRYPKGRLLLAYNTGVVGEAEVRKGEGIREVWYVASTDNGRSWSKPVNITTQVSKPNHPSVNPAYTFKEDWRSYANTPGHAVQLQKGRYKGRLYVAANHSEGAPKPMFRDYRAHGFYSDNHGQTWHLSPTVSYPGGNESTAAETADGKLMLNSRNQSGDVKARIVATSQTGGESWRTVRIDSTLPDPVCQGSLIDYKPEKGPSVLLFSNLNSTNERVKLTVRVSTDNGKSWRAGREVYGGSAAYSDLVIQADNQIGILYERDEYTLIQYASFPYTWLLQ